MDSWPCRQAFIAIGFYSGKGLTNKGIFASLTRSQKMVDAAQLWHNIFFRGLNGHSPLIFDFSFLLFLELHCIVTLPKT